MWKSIAQLITNKKDTRSHDILKEDYSALTASFQKPQMGKVQYQCDSFINTTVNHDYMELSSIISTQLHGNSLVISLLEDKNLSLEERLKLEDDLRDKMENSLRCLDKRRLLRLRPDHSKELSELFTRLVGFQYNPKERPFSSWREFVETTLKSDYGRFERFQLDLYNVPFDGEWPEKFEPLLQLIANPYYMHFGKTGDYGDQVLAVMEYLEAYRCGIPNRREILNTLEKIDQLRLEELSREAQEAIRVRNQEIKRNEQLITGFKDRIEQEFSAIEDTRVQKIDSAKINNILEVLYKLFCPPSATGNPNENPQMLDSLQENLPKIDFATVTIRAYNVLQALKNNIWKQSLTRMDEYGQTLLRLLNFIELVDMGIQAQAKINGIKREIRGIKEDAIRALESSKSQILSRMQ